MRKSKMRKNKFAKNQSLIIAPALFVFAALITGCYQDIALIRERAFINALSGLNVTPLSENTWINDNISRSNETKLYSIPVNDSMGNPYTSINLWWLDDPEDGKLDIKIDAFYENGEKVDLNSNSRSDSASIAINNSDQDVHTVYLSVRAAKSGNKGNYAIAYSSYASDKPGYYSYPTLLSYASSENNISPNANDPNDPNNFHYYQFSANYGQTYIITWNDKENSSYYDADIEVGIKKDGYSSYLVPVTDTIGGSNAIVFSLGTSYGGGGAGAELVIVEVHGTGAGLYSIKGNNFYEYERILYVDPPWYEGYIPAGAVHYYTFDANSDSTYVIEWADIDNKQGFTFQSPANIRVGAKKESFSSYIVPLTDSGNEISVPIFSFGSGSSNYRLTIEVQGVSGGNYAIKLPKW
jgi:hypothetical protein